MAIQMTGKANLGDNPTLKQVQVRGKDRKVCEFPAFFADYKSDGQNEVTQSGGFWTRVSVWDEQAEEAYRLLRKGMRVVIVGELREETWADRNSGEEKTAKVISATHLGLALSRRIRSIDCYQRSERLDGDELPAGTFDEAPL